MGRWWLWLGGCGRQRRRGVGDGEDVVVRDDGDRDAGAKVNGG